MSKYTKIYLWILGFLIFLVVTISLILDTHAWMHRYDNLSSSQREYQTAQIITDKSKFNYFHKAGLPMNVIIYTKIYPTNANAKVPNTNIVPKDHYLAIKSTQQNYLTPSGDINQTPFSSPESTYAWQNETPDYSFAPTIKIFGHEYSNINFNFNNLFKSTSYSKLTNQPADQTNPGTKTKYGAVKAPQTVTFIARINESGQLVPIHSQASIVLTNQSLTKFLSIHHVKQNNNKFKVKMINLIIIESIILIILIVTTLFIGYTNRTSMHHLINERKWSLYVRRH